MFNFGNKEFRNLQEQVLKNAQDIEVLKGIKNLQVVIVEELPEEGDPNYIYLVPNESEEEANVYNEYIWLADEEAYEQIGGVSIDLTNYVTLDTEQTVTGTKTFESFYIKGAYSDWLVHENPAGIFYLQDSVNNTGLKFERDKIYSATNNYTSLGSSSFRWKNLYLGGEIDLGNNATITKDSSNRLNFNFGGNAIIKVGSTSYIKASWVPEDNNTHDLGSSSYAWKDAYIAGNISDGVNTVSVANIASKVTSTYASGTFDSNGQDTIDISGGSPEGLFIFAYGNCQCLVHLTASMVQNADLTPIRVSCPMIFNSDAVFGWLEIRRSGTTLTIEVINDAHDHVDSGYAWTLTKTNLL